MAGDAAFRAMIEQANPDAEILPRRPIKSFATEPGAVDARGQPLPQQIMPGMEHSARQLAQAREKRGKGKKTTTRAQAAPHGLFAEPSTQEEMFK